MTKNSQFLQFHGPRRFHNLKKFGNLSYPPQAQGRGIVELVFEYLFTVYTQKYS